jgi:hypothetical protein
MLFIILVVLLVLFIALWGLALGGKIQAEANWFAFGSVVIIALIVCLGAWGAYPWPPRVP